MSLNLFILVLRIGSAVLLYLFLIGAILVMWRDWHAIAKQMEVRRIAAKRTFGQLVVVRLERASWCRATRFRSRSSLDWDAQRQIAWSLMMPLPPLNTHDSLFETGAGGWRI